MGKSGVKFVGTTPDKSIYQIFELDQSHHRFFVGVQYHPEFKSRPTQPHPLFKGLIKFAKEKKLEKERKEDVNQKKFI